MMQRAGYGKTPTASACETALAFPPFPQLRLLLAKL